MSNCNGAVPLPLPRGWTETHCPKGHTREGGNAKVVGQKKPMWACLMCQRESRAAVKVAVARGDSATVDKIPLVCGHTVLYRKGVYQRGNDDLYCFRHGAWFGQGFAA